MCNGCAGGRHGGNPAACSRKGPLRRSTQPRSDPLTVAWRYVGVEIAREASAETCRHRFCLPTGYSAAHTSHWPFALENIARRALSGCDVGDDVPWRTTPPTATIGNSG
nr:hypothetical protein CFP56_16521 [Quercus suber]